MQVFRLTLICFVSWTVLGLAMAGHHGGGIGFGGPVGLLLGVGLLAKLLQGDGGSSHHHVKHVYVPIPVHHHGHHHHGHLHHGHHHGGYGRIYGR